MSLKPFRHLLAATLSLTLIASPALAQAQSCIDLKSEKAKNIADIARIIADYPGTTIVIGLCGMYASDQYNKSRSTETAVGTFTACAALGCFLAGFSNCKDVALNWFEHSMRLEAVERALRENSCG